MAGKPFFLRVLRAVSESALDADARHIVMVMAVYAQSRTGVGLHSQETLARLTGRSERHVRAILADLSRADAAPIRIQRRPRFRADGRGRTSDEWRLTLTTDQPAPGAAYSDDQPAHDAGKPPGLTGTPRLTNRHATSDQPAPGAGDLRCDRRSDRRSSSASTSEAGSFALSSPSPQTATRPSKKTPRATKPKSKNGPAHATVTKFTSRLSGRSVGPTPLASTAPMDAPSRSSSKRITATLTPRARSSLGLSRAGRATRSRSVRLPATRASSSERRGRARTAPVPCSRVTAS